MGGMVCLLVVQDSEKQVADIVVTIFHGQGAERLGRQRTLRARNQRMRRRTIRAMNIGGYPPPTLRSTAAGFQPAFRLISRGIHAAGFGAVVRAGNDPLRGRDLLHLFQGLRCAYSWS